MKKTNDIDLDLCIIIGAPRSGTTLLSGLITGNDDCIPNLPECTVITQIIKHYHDIVNYSDRERFNIYAKDRSTLFSQYKSHVDGMLNIVIEQFQCLDYKFLTLKDPELSLYIELIPDFFDNCKIVYIVRDPRDIVVSLLKVNEKKKKTMGVLDCFSDEDLLKLSGEIYNYFYLIHESSVYKKGMVHVVNYENILNDQAEEFDKLERYIGYKLTSKAFQRSAFEFDRNDPTFSENYGKDIVNPTSDFRAVLNQSQIKVVENMFSGFNLTYRWW